MCDLQDRGDGARRDWMGDSGGVFYAERQPGGGKGDRRVGVVWHTQGSGKSLTMAFYAGKIILDPVLENPTIVVLTDRNDLDDQLFGTFARCRDLLRQPPIAIGTSASVTHTLHKTARSSWRRIRRCNRPWADSFKGFIPR